MRNNPILQKILKHKKWLGIGLIFFVIFFFGLYFLHSLFSVKEPDNKRFVALFEEYTQAKFPKSGVIVKKDYLYGLNDGWEAAIIKVDDSVEFQFLKKEIRLKKNLSSQKRKHGIGYFGSGIQKGFGQGDTIFINSERGFKLEFIENKYIVVIEKSW